MSSYNPEQASGKHTPSATTLIINSEYLPCDALFEAGCKVSSQTLTKLTVLHIIDTPKAGFANEERIKYINDLIFKSARNNCPVSIVGAPNFKQNLHSLIKKQHVINIVSYAETLHETGSFAVLKRFAGIKLYISPTNSQLAL